MFLIFAFVLLLSQPNNEIKVKDAWMRPAAKGMNSALYFRIINNSDKPDTLYKISSDLTKTVQMHETYKKGKDLMGMREVKNVVIKPHSTFEFKPMAHHVMLIHLNEDTKDKAKAVLYFKNAGKIKINISVSRSIK